MNKPLLVASWNVNSVNARLARFLGFLERVAPDVLCLQELKCVEEKFPFAAVQDLGYHVAMHGQKTYNGVAVLTKMPAEIQGVGFRDGGDDTQSRFISVKVAGITVISSYIPNGQALDSSKYIYKLEWLQRLRAYLDTHHKKSEPLILAGDFNVAPTDLDVAKPEEWRGQILFSEPEKAALANILGFGLVDTFRKHQKDGGFYSWWDYRQLAFPKNNGLRIDFVFATEPLAAKCTKAWIDRDERKGEKPSDHAPCLAEIDL